MPSQNQPKVLGGQQFRIHAALHDETSSGWVWCLLQGVKPRTLVEIKNLESGRSVVCEYRAIDNYFLDTYNDNKAKKVRSLDIAENPLVISYWYRAALGIERIGSQEMLSISPVRDRYARIRAGLEHADHMSRLATRLGLISLWLGFDSVLLGVLSVLSFVGRCIFLAASIASILIIVGSGIILGRVLRWGWPINSEE
jgi:hypothetical protein